MLNKHASAAAFESPEGLEKVQRLYSGLSQQQIEALLSTASRAVREFRKYSGKLHEKIRILDIGCGFGAKDPLLASFLNARVTAVTPFRNEFEEARRCNSHAQVKFVQSGFPFLKLKGRFNIIYSNRVFQYVTSQHARAEAFKNMARCADENAFIAINYPAKPTFSTHSFHPPCSQFKAEIES